MNNRTDLIITGYPGTLGQELRKIYPVAYYPQKNTGYWPYDYDLRHEKSVIKLYETASGIRSVIHAAAKVGGIADNLKYPEDYFYDNVMMDTLMVRYAQKVGLQRFIGILSTCAYPDVVSNYPMEESQLHAGPPAASNFSYGYGKRAMAVHIDACNAQYGTKYNYLIPCNLYSGKKITDITKAHFLDTLLHKIRFAIENNQDEIELWGTGRALRQFMLAEDLAKVISLVVENDITESFNVCPDENYSIMEMVEIALRACDATHLKVRFDKTKPDGQLNKQASNKKMKSLLPDFQFTPLEEGIRKVMAKT